MQQKLYAELANNAGSKTVENNDHISVNNKQQTDGINIGYGNRSALPYAEAFLDEVLRRGNVLPLGVPRRTLSDTMLGNFFIPKDTTVIANIWAVQNSGGVGGDGLGVGSAAAAAQSLKVFKPERFVHTVGDKKLLPGQSKASDSKQQAGFMPFGIGKRSCAGESVACMQLFILVMNLVKQCDFRQPAYREMPSDAKGLQLGATLRPAPFEVVAKSRTSQNDADGLSQPSVQQDL